MVLDGKDVKDYEAQARMIEGRLRILKEKYSAVLTNQAKIYWDLKDYKVVEQIFAESSDICGSQSVFNVNLAHAIYMQEGKH